MDINSASLAAGKTLESIANFPLLKALHEIWGIDWVMTMLGGVDTEKVLLNVDLLKKEYPQETSREISNRLIESKAIEAGKVGLITNIIPPFAASLFGLELASIARLQAEMIYEIAAAYDLDLQDPSLRGEVVGIFGLTLGGNILKAGLNLAEVFPGIGALIGASSNAVIFYALGHTACEFYEEKSRTEIENKTDFQLAFARAKTMDLALIHMVLASYRDRPWSEIMPILHQVTPSSVKTIAVNINNPEPLEILLEKLSPAYAKILLQKSYAIALWENGSINSEQQTIIDTILQKFPQIANSPTLTC